MTAWPESPRRCSRCLLPVLGGHSEARSDILVDTRASHLRRECSALDPREGTATARNPADFSTVSLPKTQHENKSGEFTRSRALTLYTESHPSRSPGTIGLSDIHSAYYIPAFDKHLTRYAPVSALPLLSANKYREITNVEKHENGLGNASFSPL